MVIGDDTDFYEWVTSHDVQAFFARAFEIWDEHSKECEHCREFPMREETKEAVSTLLRDMDTHELGIVLVTCNNLMQRYEEAKQARITVEFTDEMIDMFIRSIGLQA